MNHDESEQNEVDGTKKGADYCNILSSDTSVRPAADGAFMPQAYSNKDGGVGRCNYSNFGHTKLAHVETSCS